MTKYTKTIEWLTGTQQRASVVVELVTSRTVDADGPKIDVPCCDLSTRVYLDGDLLGFDLQPVTGHAVIVAKCGKLGIKAEQMAEINAAVASIKQSPEWIANEERAASAARANDKYESGREQMRRVMGY